MATKKKDRSAGYMPISEAVENLNLLAAALSAAKARGDRRLVKVVVQVYYGDEEPLAGMESGAAGKAVPFVEE